MTKVARLIVLGVAAFATIFTSVSTASADHRGWRHHNHRPVVVERHNNNNGVALGIVGLAAGAIIGGAIAESRANQRSYGPPVYAQPVRPPAYYPPAPTYSRPAPVYRQPAPVYSQPVSSYRGAFEPWSAGWYDYCSNRYRSFNASTGTFRGYDGQDHFCVAN